MTRRLLLALHQALAIVALALAARGACAQPEPGAASDAPPAPIQSPTASPVTAPTAASPAAPSTAVPPTASPPPADDASGSSLERAKQLFIQGNRLRMTGDCQGALPYYQDSRAMHPSVANTQNVAYCLEQLERYDEALESYERLLVEFGDSLETNALAELSATLQRLRGKTASIEVTANVLGVVVVAGRQRGDLPLRAPIRVLPGTLKVVVNKDGYEPFEKRVTVKAGETAHVDAKLRPLASSGRLAVHARGAAGADISVDGVKVGVTPWEGTLSPGRHTVVVHHGDVGTSPTSVTVLQGQTVDFDAQLRPLGPEMTISADRTSAVLTLDGVPLDASTWQGRLPAGKHVATAAEEGYTKSTYSFVVRADVAQNVELVLSVDPNHPRWHTGPKFRFWLEVAGSFGVSPSLGTGAERFASSVPANAVMEPAIGVLAGGRFGLELPNRVAFEVGAGFVRMAANVERNFLTPFDDADPASDLVRFDVRDEVRWTGGYVGAGASYRYPITPSLFLGARAHAGAVVAQAQHFAAASIVRGSEEIPALVEGTGGVVDTVLFFVQPEIFGLWSWDPIHVGVGFGVFLVPITGPDAPYGDIVENSGNGCTVPTALSCIQDSDVLSGEGSVGPTVIFTPSVAVGYSF